jgi:plastocyanin
MGGGGGGATANLVGVYDNEFVPSSLTVTAGTTVTWEFHGSYSSHNVTFDNGSGASPDLMTGTYTRTFSAVGTFPYRCRIHGAAMSGSIVVQ